MQQYGAAYWQVDIASVRACPSSCECDPEDLLARGSRQFPLHQFRDANGWLGAAPGDAPNQSSACTDSASLPGSLNNLIRSKQYRLRDRETKRLGRFEIDDKLVLGRLLDRQACWRCTL